MSLRKHRHATLTDAQNVAVHWGLDVESIELIAHSGNSVYRARRAGQLVILRLTDRAYRNHDECLAELEFVQFLAHHDVRAACPLASIDGVLIVPVHRPSVSFLCSVFEFAPGSDLSDQTLRRKPTVIYEWGHSLARLHAVSRRSKPLRRWHWHEEHLLSNAAHYLTSADKHIERELEMVLETLGKLDCTSENYGMTHADFGPGNFHYTPAQGITAFDFGNCCYHWFVWDLAIGLRYLAQQDYSQDCQRALLDGYQALSPIEPNMFAMLPLFIRLRYLYIYLDRLAKVAEHPNDLRYQKDASVARDQLLHSPNIKLLG